MVLTEMLQLWAILNGKTDNEKENPILLFKKTNMPEEIDKETLARTIVVRCGTQETIVSTTDQYKYVHDTFFAAHYDDISRIARALTEDYNPLHNYDRTEEGIDTHSGTINNGGTSANSGKDKDTVTRSGNDTAKTTIEGDSTTTDKVSAYNQVGFTDSSQSVVSDRSNPSTTTTYNSSVTTDMDRGVTRTDNFTTTNNLEDGHKLRAYGNIGVTTTQAMITEELKLRRLNLYNTIADMYASECLLSTW